MEHSSATGFTVFVDTVSGRLTAAALLMAGDLGTAEDLVQETLLRVYQAWPRILDEAAAPAFAYRTLSRLAYRRLSGWRRWQRSLTDDPPERSAPGDQPGWESRRVVRDALTQLPLRQRQTLVLRFYASLSVTETAAAMNCSTGTVKSQTTDGLARLRSLLEDAHAVDMLHT
jgi:RNA polymerase sigma-70 factor (sigma-E family)